jgi:hypothetical protein
MMRMTGSLWSSCVFLMLGLCIFGGDKMNSSHGIILFSPYTSKCYVDSVRFRLLICSISYHFAFYNIKAHV